MYVYLSLSLYIYIYTHVWALGLEAPTLFLMYALPPRRGVASHEQRRDFGTIEIGYSQVPQNHHDRHRDSWVERCAHPIDSGKHRGDLWPRCP